MAPDESAELMMQLQQQRWKQKQKKVTEKEATAAAAKGEDFKKRERERERESLARVKARLESVSQLTVATQRLWKGRRGNTEEGEEKGGGSAG